MKNEVLKRGIFIKKWEGEGGESRIYSQNIHGNRDLFKYEYVIYKCT